MNRVYLLMLALLVSCTSAFAQRTVNLQILPSEIGKTLGTVHNIANGEKILYDGDGNSKYYFFWSVKNLGPDSLIPGDSLIFRTAFGYPARVLLPAGTFLKKDSSLSVFPSSGGQPATITLSPNSTITTSHTQTGVSWCDSVYAKVGTAVIMDPNTNNNDTCVNVDLTFWLTGVNTVTYEADGFLVYPNPSNGKLNVKFDLGNNAQNVNVVLRDVVGKVVYSHNFGTASGTIEHPINVTHLTPGMYTAELGYNGQRIVSKVSIQ